MKRFFLPVAIVLLAMTAGCRIQVDKNKEGGDKNVKIDTPVGGIHVKTDQLSASDVGLPAYPGAQIVGDKDGDKSADIHLGFGKWQLQVKAVGYRTGDSQEQVLAFYRKALGRYGDVIECNNGNPVGTPTATREGLTCSDKHGSHVQTEMTDNLNVRAGSSHHQHIVEIKKSDGNSTRFGLIELQLPEGLDDSSASQ